MSKTAEPIVPVAPGLSNAEIAAAAARADLRAAEAKKAADRASKVAKEARATAGKASREAATLRDSIEPKTGGHEALSPAMAKQRFLEAARAIDPVGSVRMAVTDHPFVTVGAALGTGAVLGTFGGTIGSMLRLGLSFMKLAKPLALAGAQFAASRMAANQSAATSNTSAPPDATTTVA